MPIFTNTTYKYCFVGFIILATGIFGFFTYQGFTSNQPQASLTVEREAYQLQDRIEVLFPRRAHTAPYMVYSSDESSDVLTRDVLASVLEQSNKLRKSEFGQKYLINFKHPEFGETDKLGFYTVADAVNDILKKNNLTLESATNEEFNSALNTLYEDSEYKKYFHLVTSDQLRLADGKWQAPAFQFYVQADNDLFGGGVFRRTVGSTDSIIAKEQFNREVQERMGPITNDANLLGIGIDLNLEAEDEGYSFGVLARNGLLVFALALLTGFILRSWKVGAIAFLGLSTLFIWILGFPVLAGDLIKASLMTRVILPLAFMAIGIDFYVYVINEYEKQCNSESEEVVANSQKLYNGFTIVSTALILAAISDGIAFGANYMSAAEAVRSFAVTGIFAAGAAFIVMGVFSPILLSIWDEVTERVVSPTSLSLRRVVDYVLAYKTLTMSLLVIVTLITTVGLFKIDEGLSPKDFISSESKFVKSININDRHWTESRGERASIFVTGNLDNQQAQQKLEQTKLNLENNKKLAHNPVDNSLVLPLGSWQIKNITSDKEAALLVVEISDTRNLKTIEKVEQSLQNDITPIKEIANDSGITGSPFTRKTSLNAVADSLTKTFAVALIAILALLLLTFRSIKFALITLSPIILVSIWTFGLMGLIGFDLNFITATIAAVSLGIGIDYAIHVVQSYREKLQHGRKAREAMGGVSDTTMVASFVAFVSSVVGFVILATAPMPLFATYGILGAAMVTFAFISVITLLPILLIWAS